MGRKGRLKGTTYHLVQRPYEERTGTGAVSSAPVWVSDAEFRRGQRSDRGSSRYHGMDDSTEELPYDGEWDAELHEPGWPRKDAPFHATTATHEENDDGLDDDWDSVSSHDEDVDEEREEEGLAGSDTTSAAHKKPRSDANVTHSAASSAADPPSCGSAPVLTQKRVRVAKKNEADADSNGTENDDDDAEAEKLFEDEVECEVTDDFLRQLVFGSPQDTSQAGGADVHAQGERKVHFAGDVRESGTNDNRSSRQGMAHGSRGGPFAELDEEVVCMLTEEEKSAMIAAYEASNGRAVLGKTGQREMTGSIGGADDDEDAIALRVGHTHSDRALEAQFDQVMQEFNADAHLNDAYADDPRMHGPLGMDKYMMALEEFVADRAGIDLETTEPAKNKGLIHQLKMLAHRAGVLDVDRHGGVFLTTVPSNRQSRFAAEFHAETERIRHEARQRMEQHQSHNMSSNHAADTGEPRGQQVESTTTAAAAQQPLTRESAHPASVTMEKDDGASESGSARSDDRYVMMNVRTKADRVDCETAASVYSTYFNQPNVIRATAMRKPAKARTNVVGGGDSVARRTKESKAPLYNAAGSCPASVGKSQDAVPTRDASGAGEARTKTDCVSVEETPITEKARQTSTSSTDMTKSRRHIDTVADVPVAVGAYVVARGEKVLRPKEETAEEKRKRQKAVKAMQRERRHEKSKIKSLYKTVERDEIKRESVMKAAHSTVHIA